MTNSLIRAERILNRRDMGRILRSRAERLLDGRDMGWIRVFRPGAFQHLSRTEVEPVKGGRVSCDGLYAVDSGRSVFAVGLKALRGRFQGADLRSRCLGGGVV